MHWEVVYLAPTVEHSASAVRYILPYQIPDFKLLAELFPNIVRLEMLIPKSDLKNGLPITDGALEFPRSEVLPT